MRLSEKQASDLIEILKALTDPRCKRGCRHRNLSIIAISICAVICGCRGYSAIAQWASIVLKKCWSVCGVEKKTISISLPVNRPSDANCRGLMPKKLIGPSLIGLPASSGNAIGIDGKTLRGARRDDGTKVHLLSAFIHQQGITIAQKEVPAKSNEIPTAIPLLEPLHLKGKVVTADAFHTHKTWHPSLFREKQADYCFTVKDNQSNLKEDIAYLGLNEAFPPSA